MSVCLMRPLISSNSRSSKAAVAEVTSRRYAFSASRYAFTSGLSRSRSQ